MATFMRIFTIVLFNSLLFTSVWAEDNPNYCQISGGACLEFDGSNSYVDFGTDPSLSLSPTNMTISAWVRPGENTAGHRMGIVGKMARGTYQGFSLTREDSNRYFFLQGDGTAQVLHGVGSNTTYTASEWHHLAGVIGSKSYLYIDGIQQSETNTFTFLDSGDNAYAGRYYSNSDTRMFDGMIDDVRFYNRALSPPEVATAMNTAPTGDASLKGYWNFDEGLGQIAFDRSSNNNHGRLGSFSSSDSDDPDWVDTSVFCAVPVPMAPTISGYVLTSGGVGLSGVTISADNGGGSTTTNTSGYYSLTVLYGWSGRVTPALSGYAFSLTYMDYTGVVSDQSNRNYLALPIAPPAISGTIRTSAGVGVAGVTVSANNGGGTTSTNTSGYYSITVPHGWSGRVTPTLSGYTFTPIYLDYTGVSSNQTNRNYTATPIAPPTISGTIRTSGGVGVSGVTVAGNNGGGSTTTNASGYYSITVPHGWFGRVTPTLSGYTFTPNYLDYTGVSSNQTNRNYTAIRIAPPAISGTIRTSSGTGVSGVTVAADNGGWSTTTNISGYYRITVPFGWSGRVTPTLNGYTFSPPYLAYTNVSSNLANRNYTATPIAPPVISGTIRTTGGAGVASVTVSADNGGGSATTNTSGFYSLTVPYGWSGPVTPTLNGYTFTPTYLDYTNVGSDQSNRNYTALPIAPPAISGYIRMSSGVRMASVTVTANNGGGSATTSRSGYYSITVPYGWSGRVTPTLSGYTLTPPYLDYVDVISNRMSQNYTALPVVPPVISGTIRTADGAGVPGVTVAADNGGDSTTTSTSGYYSITVPYGWSGRITPTLSGHTFDPFDLDYVDLISNRTSQDYLGLPIPTADTFYVDTANGNDFNTGQSPGQAFQSIQRGIDATINGNTVVVLDGVYQGPGNKELDFGGRAIILKAQNGSSAVTIDCENSGRAFYFHTAEGVDSIVEGFTLINGSAQQGGAIYCIDSSPTIKRCVFINNVASTGGAIHIENSDAIVQNCVLAFNFTYGGPGGAIRCDNGFRHPVIANCTVINNVSNGAGGGLWCNQSNVAISNSIFWNNRAFGDGMQIGVLSPATLSVNYSDVQGGQPAVQTSGNLIWGAGNLDVDPLLADPNNGDYHLLSMRGRYWPQFDIWVLDEHHSPAIDAGDSDTDVLDEPLPNGGLINMGAYGGTNQASRSDAEAYTVVRDEDGNGIIEYPQDLSALIERWFNEFTGSIQP